METITIECNDDGTYRVTSTEDKAGEPGDAPLDQTVKSVDEVMQLIQGELSDDGDQAGQWASEAAKRGPDGQPLPAAPGTPGAPGAGQPPQMSM